MKIDAFLDKKEARQLQLVRQTILAGGRLADVELMQRLQIAKASLEKDLQDLLHFLPTFHGAITLHYDGQWLTIDLAADFSLLNLYRAFLKNAIKFQIVDHLYQYKEFTIAQLTTKLALSESSLFRKIKELNGALQDFQIQIKNGQLQGEELQIRYFYFQLYWQLVPYEHHQAVTMTLQNQRTVAALEKALAFAFSETSRLQISLWLSISKRRLSVSNKRYQQLTAKMSFFQEDPLYLQVRQFVLRFLSRYPLEFDEGEAMLHFVFLITRSILSQAAFSDYVLLRKRRALTSLADTIILETIVLHYQPQKFTPSLEKQIVYYLAHIHSQVYFLAGQLEFYEQSAWIQSHETTTHQTALTFARSLLQKSCSYLQVNLNDENSLYESAVVYYAQVFALIEEELAGVVDIALDFKLAPLEAALVSQLLFSALKGVNRIQIERYQPQKVYNLIITDHQHSKNYQGRPYQYVLSEFACAYDLQQLQKLIQKLLSS